MRMPTCERCWSMSGGDATRYRELLTQEKCTLQQQAGPGRTECPVCKEDACHQHTGQCLACGYESKN